MQSHSHKVRRRRNRARVGFVRPSDTGRLPRQQAWAGSSPRSAQLPCCSCGFRASLVQGLCLCVFVVEVAGAVATGVRLVSVCVLSGWAYQDGEGQRRAFSAGPASVEKRGP